MTTCASCEIYFGTQSEDITFMCHLVSASIWFVVTLPGLSFAYLRRLLCHRRHGGSCVATGCRFCHRRHGGSCVATGSDFDLGEKTGTDEPCNVGIRKLCGRWKRLLRLLLLLLLPCDVVGAGGHGLSHELPMLATWSADASRLGSCSSSLHQALHKARSGRVYPPFCPMTSDLAETGTTANYLWRTASEALAQRHAGKAVRTFWAHADLKNFAAFGNIFEGLAMLMLGGAHGMRSKVVDALAAHVLVIRSYLDLQRAARSFASTGRWRKWAAQVLRLLPPGAIDLIREGDVEFKLRIMDVMLGVLEGFQGVVYCLWTGTLLYVGKCIVARVSAPGIPARVGEHIRLTLTPHHRDGGSLRYRALRVGGLLSMRFFPSMFFKTASQALAAESVIHRLTRPALNEKDTLADGKLVTPIQKARLKTPRRRPPSWIRKLTKARSAESIWTTSSAWWLLGRAAVARTLHTTEELLGYPGVLGAQACFSVLYVLQIKAYFAETGIIGPLFLFDPLRTVLWLSFCAAGRGMLRLPTGWDRERLASFLYYSVDSLPMLRRTWRRAKARNYLDKLLLRHRLPPVRIPPVVVPAFAAVASRRLITGMVWRASASLRTASARTWLRRHLSFTKGAQPRWSNVVNASKICRSFEKSSLTDLGDEELCSNFSTSSLSGLNALWKLPRWPTGRYIKSAVNTAWGAWGDVCRLPPMMIRRGRRVVDHACANVAALVPPFCPSEWQLLEDHLQQLVVSASDGIFFGDDKSATKLWSVKANELHCYMLSTLLSTPGWSITRMSLQAALAYEVGRAKACLPPFLTRRPVTGNAAPPSMFPLCKSKCFTDDGDKKCVVQGHSCMRRVIDCSRAPFRFAWRMISRGARGVIASVCVTHELFDLDMLRPMLDARLKALSHSDAGCCCARAGCASVLISPSVVVADVDQAFEACSAASVKPAWELFASLYQQKFDTSHIVVHRVTRAVTSIGMKGFGGATVCLSMDMITRALLGYSFMTLVSYGDVVWSMQGLPIGGLASMVCVALVLGRAEYDWSNNSVGQKRLGYDLGDTSSAVCWIRFVDDVLAISTVLCPTCLYDFVAAAYPVKLSPVSGLETPSASEHTWVDVSLIVVGATIHLVPKNPNRKWLHGNGLREKVVFTEWAGRPSQPFGTLRAILINRIRRVQRLGLNHQWQAYRVLEDVTELVCVGYPIAFIRKLLHSLPASAAARILRKFIRSWAIAMVVPSGSGSGGRAHGGQPRKDRGGGADHNKKSTNGRGRKSRRSRSRSAASSSSTSSSVAARKKLERAKKTLLRSDPEYKVFLKQTEEKKKKEDIRVQAEAFRDALAGAFDGLIASKSAEVFPPSHPGVPVGGHGFADAAASAPPAGVVVDPNVLSKVKARLLESEFGHIFSITGYTKSEVLDILAVHFKPPKNRPLLTKFVSRYAAHRVVPTQAAGITNLIWDIIQEV